MSRLPLAIAAAVAALGLAAVSAVDAAGNALRNRMPQTVAAFPGETLADVNLLDRNMIAKKDVSRDAGINAARAALRDDPLNSTALRVYMASLEGSKLTQKKVEIAELAGRASKRDTLIRLVLFENAARERRGTNALDNIDAILRVEPASQRQLFPILKQLLGDSDFREHLVPYLAGRSQWALEFARFAADDRVHVGDIGDVVARAGPQMSAAERSLILPYIVTRSLEAGAFNAVPALVSLISPNGDAVLRSERWTTDAVDGKFGLAAWQSISDATTSTSFIGSGPGQDRKLSVYAASGAGGVAASKYLFLTPGSYRLRHNIEFGEGSPGGQSAEWRLKCIGKPAMTTVWSSRNLMEKGNGNRDFKIDVPAECDYQFLELVAAVDFQAADLEMTIDKFRLTATAPTATTSSGASSSLPPSD